MSDSSVHSIRYIPTLNGWRAVAILWVMISHFRHSLVAAGVLKKNVGLYNLFLHADIAIDLFFGLSGLLITKILFQELQSKGRIDYKSFFIKRFFRLLPASMVYLMVIAIFQMMGWLETSWLGIVASLFLFRNYVPQKGWYSGQFWSLSVEEHFYLIWPFVLSFVNRYKVILGTLAFLGVSIVYREMEYGLDLGFFQIDGVKKYYRTDYVISHLIWGCVFGLLTEIEVWRMKLQKSLNARVALISLLILIALTMANDQWVSVPLLYVTRGMLFPIIMLATAYDSGSYISRFLESKVMVHIGVISYSLYVWQQLFLSFKVEDSFLGYLQMAPVNFAFAILAAHCSYRWIEIPTRDYGRRVANGLQ